MTSLFGEDQVRSHTEFLIYLLVVIGGALGLSIPIIKAYWPKYQKVVSWFFAIALFLMVALLEYFLDIDVVKVTRKFIGDSICYTYTVKACPQEIRDWQQQRQAENVKRAEQEAQERRKDERAWKEATDPTTLERLRKYLAEFPRGQRAGEARKLIEALESAAPKPGVAPTARAPVLQLLPIAVPVGMAFLASLIGHALTRNAFVGAVNTVIVFVVAEITFSPTNLPLALIGPLFFFSSLLGGSLTLNAMVAAIIAAVIVASASFNPWIDFFHGSDVAWIARRLGWAS